jgi:alpha-tubulin suppressor-like RCC1 family protein
MILFGTFRCVVRLASLLSAVIPVFAAAQAGSGGITGFGRFGFGESVSSLAPITKVVSSQFDMLAIRADGTVIVWGCNGAGGWETTICNPPKGLSDVINVVDAGDHALALTKSGKVVAWGNFKPENSAPPAGLTGVIDIAAYYGQNFAVKRDGSVVTWPKANNVPAGLNNVAHIVASDVKAAIKKDGTVVYWDLPDFWQKPPANLTNVKDIWIDRDSGLALKNDGTLQGWGKDNNLGTEIPAGLTGVTSFAIGAGAVIAVKSNGQLVGWGSTYKDIIPIPANASPAIGVAIGTGGAVAVRSDGSLAIWGKPSTIFSTDVAYNPLLGIRDVVQVSPYNSRYFALLADGTVFGWDNADNYSKIPAGLSSIKQVVGSYRGGYALKADGTVIGLGFETSPATIKGAVQIAEGVALLSDSTVKAWAGPTPPAGLTGITRVVSNGTGNRSVAFGIKKDGTVVGWGSNDDHFLEIPVGLNNVTQIAVSLTHVVALKSDGKLVAWGSNGYGQLDFPADLPPVRQIAVGNDGTVAVMQDGTVRTWGHFVDWSGFEVLYPTLAGIDNIQVQGEFILVTPGVAILPETWNGIAGKPSLVNVALPTAATTNTDVTITSSAPEVVVPATVRIAAGSRKTTFTADLGSNFTGTVILKATLGKAEALTTIVVRPYQPISGLTFTPNPVAGGKSATGKLVLTEPAPTGGLVVTLTTDNAVTTVPASVTVPEKAKFATFSISTSAVTKLTTATISAATGKQIKKASLSIKPAAPPSLRTLTLSATPVTGGSNVTGKITLDAPAPAGGIVVSLSDSTDYASEPSSVTVAEGASAASFIITTTAVPNNVSATVTATLGTVSKTASLTIVPPSLLSLTLTPSSVQGGKTSTAKVTINGPAATGGFKVSVASSDTSATVPQTVTVPAGATFVRFAVKTKKVTATTSATITCSVGTANQKATLTISP